MHGSRSKITSKNLVRQRCAEEFNSGGKGFTQQQLTAANKTRALASGNRQKKKN
jgi:hypothetical protein